MKNPILNMLKRRTRDEVGLSEEDGIRYLHFGSVWIQGGMRMDDPYRLELEYTRQLFAGLLFQPQPKNVLLLGLGAASASKFAWKALPRARVTTVELNPAVIACARQYFHLPADSGRMRTVEGDGAAWVAAHPESCDYLVVDVYDAAARGPVLSSAEFYADCRNAMAQDRLSVLAVNLFGRDKSFKVNHANMERAFDGRVLALPATDRGNVIAFAFTGPQLETTWAELRRGATELRERTGLEFPKWVTGFKSANGFGEAPVI